MRRRTISSFGYVCLTNSAVDSMALTHNHHQHQQQRHITTRGQFNPLHDFGFAMHRGVRVRDEKTFEKLITNPGPLRIAYSPDYLDWLYRCYRAKVKYMDAREAAEKKFNGNLITGESVVLPSSGGGSGSNSSKLPGAPPPGMFLRPPHSFRRLTGEMKRRHAQETLDEVSKAQGILDLFERQPQFPAIHIDRCSRFHLVELFKEMVLERSLEATAIWDKALLYRAILSERKSSYPPSFRYIFKSVEDTVFAPNSMNCPSMEAYYYFLYLVKKYYIDNAVEAHVVLRCHQEPNAADLLFSNPPPKDDVEVRKSIDLLQSAETASPSTSSAAGIENTTKSADNNNSTTDQEGSSDSKGKNKRRFIAPSSYPPISTLWRCEENLPLLKILLFGEFNLIVSENPFVKFPNAHDFLTRPYSTDSSKGSMESASLANIIAEKRGRHLPSFPRNLASSIDARAQDLRRLQQKHHRDDIVSFQKLLRSTQADDNPSTFSSYSDWSYFNPRAVRAEERDRLTRKGINALKEYDSSREDIYRHSFEDAEASNSRRVTEQQNTFPSCLPTLPHFVSVIKKDPHISFLLHVGLPEKLGSAEAAAKHKEFERRIFQLARALYHTALEFHREEVRRVNRQKVNVAASLLDSFVEQEWAAMLRDGDSPEAACTPGGLVDGKVDMARRLGRYMRFARRSLDESGFPTDARADDYTRWMAPPARAKGTA